MKKVFVLRTEALLASKDPTLRFGDDNTIVVPMAILQNLYRYKGVPEKMSMASRFVEYIDSLPQNDLLSEGGFKQENGSYLRIVDNGPIEQEIANLADFSRLDHRVFQVCKDLKKKSQKVILISRNPNIRLKGNQLGIDTELFKDEIFPKPCDQYKGIVEVFMPGSSLEKMFTDERGVPVEEVYQYENFDWIENEFVEIVSDTSKAIGRYTNGRIVRLKYDKSIPGGHKALNVEQVVFWESLLMPPDIAPLVVTKGVAGTGKTYCSLAMALNAIEKKGDKKKQTYKQIIVATPTVTVANEELGFLPGEIDDKVGPYLGGIVDNLKEILRQKFPDFTNAELKKKAMEFFERGDIEIQPIGFLRGRTIPNTVFIIDETQNIKPCDIKDIVTRSAEGSKFIFWGDADQVNNPALNSRYNGLVYLSEKMKGNPHTFQITLNSKKSVRSKLAQEALDIL